MAITDNRTPGLSATNNLTVTVNPVTNPEVGAVTVLEGQVNLMVSGPQGPDYTLVDANPADPARFYRIQIGP
ncbi:MAG: hypothetical protein ABSD57_15105 [Verrucomicrobiota bacterium]